MNESDVAEPDWTDDPELDDFEVVSDDDIPALGDSKESMITDDDQ